MRNPMVRRKYTMEVSMPNLNALPQDLLTSRLESLAKEERSLLVDFLQLLAAFDRRKLYADVGFESLYLFCTKHLHLSEGATFRRIVACRLLARFPGLAPPLRDGRLTLT